MSPSPRPHSRNGLSRTSQRAITDYFTPTASRASTGIITHYFPVLRTAPGSVTSGYTIEQDDRDEDLERRFAELLTPTTIPTHSGGSRPRIEGAKSSGVERDPEGIETRKALLERRRSECSPEEVDVALAPVMKLRVPFSLYPAQYRRFRELFPRVNIDSGLNFNHHDHPVAHAATMAGTRYIQARLPQSSLVLDLHGNPTGNENFNRYQEQRSAKRPHLGEPTRVETFVEMHDAADAVRKATKWGPEFGPKGERRWSQGGLHDVPAGKYQAFTGIHTLYYYKKAELCYLFKRNPGAVGYFLVNYSKEQSGSLYGELQFSKSDGVTVQTSPNGETYRHNDIDGYFQTNSYRSFSPDLGGLAWTSHNVGGPLYVVVMTWCPHNLATKTPYAPPLCPTLKVEQGHKFFGFVTLGGRSIRLSISNKPLADSLRHFMTLRNRADPQTFKDLVVKARRCTSPDLVSGSQEFEVEPGHLQDHIIYAFLVDAPGELELMNGIAVLKADCLVPLSRALNFDSDPKVDGVIKALFRWILPTTPLAPGLAESKPAAHPPLAMGRSLLPSRRK